ncbi:unnamed protein product [Ranitomeya imitator]|uniref:Helix-turn-helix domain-containing protein n=1 Tax=Ranitomeya imitator TaxID=111125 RepID=A0ABN9MFN0_9NEOB|nr:unnamed protein product [Ranitomeya imitator]
MGAWERSIFQDGTIPEMDKVQGWMRYIDDIWFVWEGTMDELHRLMNKLNDNSLNIHLTYKCGRKLDFLDLKIEVLDDGTITTDLYRKPTSTNSLLHYSSSHPASTIRGIPIGQFLRARRICSQQEAFEEQAVDLVCRFSNRGYSKKSIRRGYKRAINTPRAKLLHPPIKKCHSNMEEPVRFISNFNNQWNELRKILNKHWNILKSDPILRKVIPTSPQMVAKRSQNIKDLLVHSHYDSSRNIKKRALPDGFFPCGFCKACLNLRRTFSFSNWNGSKNYEIRKHLTCASRGVIYYAKCPCEMIYIGLTTRELKIRVREHIRDIEKAATIEDISILKTLPRHFKAHHKCNPRGLIIWGIDQVELGIRGGDLGQVLAQYESRWIFRLGTLTPQGLNENLGFNAFL